MKQTTEKSSSESKQLGTNQSGMRAYNEKLVLTLLRTQGATPKAEIARKTGLSAQTVSVIMRELEAEGLLVKKSPKRGKVGQPSVPLALNPEGAFFYGLKIGRRSAEVVLTDFLGKIVARERLAYEFPTVEGVLAFVVGAVERISFSMEAQGRARIAGLGVAMPFELWSWAQFIGIDPIQMNDWRHVKMVDELSARFDFPIFLHNDVTAACAAELIFGARERPSNLLYIFVGYFVGGGVVIRDQVYAGSSGNAGAIGSMMVKDDDENVVQLLEISSIATLEQSLAKNGLKSDLIWDDVQNWDVPAELLEGWVRSNAKGLAQAIIQASALIDFEAVVIDGWLAEDLRTQLVYETSIAYQMMRRVGLTETQIVEGSLGVDARPLGAATLPLAHRFLVT